MYILPDLDFSGYIQVHPAGGCEKLEAIRAKHVNDRIGDVGTTWITCRYSLRHLFQFFTAQKCPKIGSFGSKPTWWGGHIFSFPPWWGALQRDVGNGHEPRRRALWIQSGHPSGPCDSDPAKISPEILIFWPAESRGISMDLASFPWFFRNQRLDGDHCDHCDHDFVAEHAKIGLRRENSDRLKQEPCFPANTTLKCTLQYFSKAVLHSEKGWFSSLSCKTLFRRPR